MGNFDSAVIAVLLTLMMTMIPCSFCSSDIDNQVNVLLEEALSLLSNSTTSSGFTKSQKTLRRLVIGVESAAAGHEEWADGHEEGAARIGAPLGSSKLNAADTATLFTLFETTVIRADWAEFSVKARWGVPGSDPCLWQGITCSMGFVIGVNFAGLSVEKVGRGLALFSDLSILILSGNAALAGDEEGTGEGRVPWDEICSCPLVQSLELDGIGLRKLPECLKEMAGSLVMLLVADNMLTELPASLAALTGLEFFRAPGNRLTQASFPEALAAWGSTAMSPLRLMLSNNKGITSLPPAILKMNLMALMLSNCSLTELSVLDVSAADPETYPALGTLRNLNLNGNQIADAAKLCSFSVLAELDIGENAVLAVVPPCLTAKDSISDLSLGASSLVTTLPAFSPTSRLRVLRLERMAALTSLPDLSRLPLEMLHLEGTGLVSLPALPGARLITLRLVNNPRLSGDLHVGLEALRQLQVRGCPQITGLSPTSAPGNDTLVLPKRIVSLVLADTGVTSLKPLCASEEITEVELSLSSQLGPGALECLPSWGELETFNARRVGLKGDIDTIFGEFAFAALNLVTLDLSENEVTGVVEGSFVGFLQLYMLSLDRTNITRFAEVDNVFPALVALSLRHIHTLKEPLPMTWAKLRSMDVRGSLASPAHPLVGLPPDPLAETYIDVLTDASCPAAFITGSQAKFSLIAEPALFGYEGCTCQNAFFGRPAANRPCVPCPAGDVVCIGGTAATRGGAFQWDPNLNRVSRVPCPVTSASGRNPCISSTLSSTVTSRSEWNANIGDGVSAVECIAGRAGRLCMACASGYFRSGSSCIACSNGLGWLPVVLTLAALVAIACLSVRAGARGGAASQELGLLTILVTHAQLLLLVPDLLGGRFNLAIRVNLGGSSGLKLDGLECLDRGDGGAHVSFSSTAPTASADHARRMAFLMACATPGTVAALAVFVALITSRYLGSQVGFRGRFMTAFARLWLMSMFSTLALLLAPLNCSSYGGSGSSFVASALWVKCGTRSHLSEAVVGGSLALIYGAFTVFLLPRFARGHGALGSMLRAPYRESPGKVWGALTFGRQSLLVIISALSPIMTPVLALGTSAILTLSLVIHLWVKPYRGQLLNFAEAVSLAVLIVSFVTATASFSSPKSASSSAAAWSLIIVNLIVLLTLASTAAFSTARTLLNKFANKFKTARPEIDPDSIEIDPRKEPLLLLTKEDQDGLNLIVDHN